MSHLTKREREVACLAGFTNQETAELLCVTTRTVEMHWHNICWKLQTKSKCGAFIRALQDGLIDIGHVTDPPYSERKLQGTT